MAGLLALAEMVRQAVEGTDPDTVYDFGHGTLIPAMEAFERLVDLPELPAVVWADETQIDAWQREGFEMLAGVPLRVRP